MIFILRFNEKIITIMSLLFLYIKQKTINKIASLPSLYHQVKSFPVIITFPKKNTTINTYTGIFKLFSIGIFFWNCQFYGFYRIRQRRKNRFIISASLRIPLYNFFMSFPYKSSIERVICIKIVPIEHDIEYSKNTYTHTQDPISLYIIQNWRFKDIIILFFVKRVKQQTNKKPASLFSYWFVSNKKK